MQAFVLILTGIHYLSYFTVSASPPVGTFVELGEASKALAKEVVSTELTLAPPNSLNVPLASDDSAGLALGQRPWQFNHNTDRPVLGPEASYRFYHSDSSAFFHVRPSTSRALQLSTSAHAIPPIGPRLTRSTAVFPDSAGASGQVDTVFSNLLRDQNFGNLLALPRPSTFIPSPWMGDIYHNIINAMQPGREPFASISVSGDTLRDLLHGKRSPNMSLGRVYIMEIDANKWGSAERRQVLFKRYHKHDFEQQGYRTDAIAFWSTAQRGQQLALLGVYEFRRYLLIDFVECTHAKEFKPRLYTHRGYTTYLIEVPQGSKLTS